VSAPQPVLRDHVFLQHIFSLLASGAVILSFSFITAHNFKVPALNWWAPGDSNCVSTLFLLKLKVFMFVSPQPVYAH
jgi:hypothetical protein